MPEDKILHILSEDDQWKLVIQFVKVLHHETVIAGIMFTSKPGYV